MENNIAFKDLVNWCREYLQGIITQEELSKNLQDLQVLFYKPLNEKIFIVQDIIYNTNFVQFPIELRLRDLEIAKILKGFLSYFPNISYESDDKALIENCDIFTYENIKQVLFVGSPDLRKLFREDYEELCSLLDSTISQGEINQISHVFDGVDTDILVKENKKLRRTFKDITTTSEGQKAVEDLLEIARFNDPAMKRIIQAKANEVANEKISKKKK